jgi:hypothetical protein
VQFSEEAEARRLERCLAAVTGPANVLWKGNEASYSALHHYLIKHFPKVGVCENCGQQSDTQYALLKGRSYSRSREDYWELCPTCHMRYDQGGELNVQAKLSAEQVAEIRRRHIPGRSGQPRKSEGPGPRPGSTRALAAEFGVSHTTIRLIVSGRKWAVTMTE